MGKEALGAVIVAFATASLGVFYLATVGPDEQRDISRQLILG
jgi:hypothetical protein